MARTKKREHAPEISVVHLFSTSPTRSSTTARSLRRRCWLTAENVLDWTPKVLVSPSWTMIWSSRDTWLLVKRLYMFDTRIVTK
jgi:hypothetical protein